MTTAQRVTAWIVTDALIWKSTPDSRRTEIRNWLKLNGVTPSSVPADSTVIITEVPDGSWEIWYEQYRRDADGYIVIDPANPNEAFVDEVRLPLAIDPPLHWLVPVTD